MPAGPRDSDERWCVKGTKLRAKLELDACMVWRRALSAGGARPVMIVPDWGDTSAVDQVDADRYEWPDEGCHMHDRGFSTKTGSRA